MEKVHWLAARRGSHAGEMMVTSVGNEATERMLETGSHNNKNKSNNNNNDDNKRSRKYKKYSLQQLSDTPRM